MRVNKVITVLISLFMAAAITPTSVNAQESKSVKEVATAVEQLRQAMISADGTILDKLASDSLSYGHSGGLLQNKQEFIKSFTSGASVFVTIDITDQHITVVGNTATVRHILSAKTNDAGKGPGTVKISILLVWIKVKTGWQLLARQAVKVA